MRWALTKFCLLNPSIVEYSTTEEARKAIETLNETQLNGRTVFVREVSAAVAWRQPRPVT